MIKNYTRINEDSRQTKEFFEYVIKKLMEHEPLKSGDLVRVKIEQGKTPFPLFSINLLNGDNDTYVEHKIEDAEKDLGGQVVGLMNYLNNSLKHGAVSRLPELEKLEPLTFTLVLIALKVDELDKISRELKINTEHTKEIVSIENKSDKKISKVTLYLNEVGDLWREPKSKYFYGMVKGKAKHRIFDYLLRNSGYNETSVLAHEGGIQTNEALRNEIYELRKEIKSHFGKSLSDLIESKAGPGYRMNPNYKIERVP